MNPAEFILYADSVSQNAAAGASGFRSAVSRAYYGAFLQVRDLIIRPMGYRLDSGGSEHKRAQLLLKECSVPEGQELGQLLHNLHESRLEADYEMTLPDCEKQSTSKLCVERARVIEQKVNACSTGMLFTKIKLGIKAYLRKTNQL